MCSCSKAEFDIDPTSVGVESFTVVDGKLKFSNSEQLDSVLHILLCKTEEQRESWYDSVGFVSQESLWHNALKEFELLNNVDQLPEFKNRYKSVFLFNDYVKDDFQPYLPCNKPGYSLIINADGDVIVDDSLKNYNFSEFEQTMYYKSQQAYHDGKKNGTKATIRYDNYLYVENGARKFWAEVFRSHLGVWIRFTAQKHNVFGWNHYNENFNTELTVIEKDTPMGWSHINVEEVSNVYNRAPVWVGPLRAGHELSIGTVCKVPNYIGNGIAMFPDICRQYYVYSDDIGAPYGGILRINLPACTN